MKLSELLLLLGGKFCSKIQRERSSRTNPKLSPLLGGYNGVALKEKKKKEKKNTLAGLPSFPVAETNEGRFGGGMFLEQTTMTGKNVFLTSHSVVCPQDYGGVL